MNILCLTSTDVGNLLRHILDNKFELHEVLVNDLEAARSWDLCIVLHNLFVARHLISSNDGLKKLEILYTLKDEMALEPQEANLEFIDYMLHHIRKFDESMDEMLVRLQEELSDYNYDRSIRY